MGIISLLIVSLLYLVTAWDYFKKEEPGMALAFGAYALANIGFIINLIRLGEKSQ
jgi:hypothetical protein